jgi:hypothetical protein
MGLVRSVCLSEGSFVARTSWLAWMLGWKEEERREA